MLQYLLKMQTTLTTVFIVLFYDRVRPTTSCEVCEVGSDEVGQLYIQNCEKVVGISAQ